MKIPSILCQSWKTNQIPKSVKSMTDSWKKSNPNLKINFMDDTECSDFILKHFGTEVHEKYLSFPQNIMRADFWRIAVVYINGGYYSDLDVECNVALNKIINNLKTIDCVLILERNNISNFFFGFSPKHTILKNTLDAMLKSADNINNLTVQNFGMHPLHQCVQEYFNVVNDNYISNTEVCFLSIEKLQDKKKLIHHVASNFQKTEDYDSWRINEYNMQKNRKESCNILFFTTFNKNGYELYGLEWIKSFIKIANYYNKFKAKVYYEGFEPDTEHSSIEWIKYESAIPQHEKWKKEYLEKTTHTEYVKTMTVRFSHKAFVIQDVLENNTDDYLIWLDGDCVFKVSDYTDFPSETLSNKFLACQVEHNHELNHVESGILIFNGKHKDKMSFVKGLKKHYDVDNIITMREPYDGFLIFKTLLTTKIEFIDLNEGYGKGGIQSDPAMTFCHPDISSKFIHNIGWTGKNQYENWDDVLKKDHIYKIMSNVLMGSSKNPKNIIKKQNAFEKLQQLRLLR